MKEIFLKYFSILVSALFLSGCIVQSTKSYYTNEVATIIPVSLHGEWSLHSDKKTKSTTNINQNKIKPWVLSKNTLVTYDSNNVKGVLKIKFFKVNGVLYCDSSPQSPDKKQHNMYWVAHVNPMHMLSRVTVSDKQLQFTPIRSRGLKDIINDNKLLLSFTKTSSGPIYTAKSAKWVEFLQKYGSDPKLFGDKTLVTLKRQ